MQFWVTFATAITLSVCARATAIFTLSDGVNPLISVTDNGPGDESPATGVLVVQTNIGVWNLTIDVGITKPIVGSPTSPVMDINLQANSTAAGNLTVTFSDTDFGPVNGILNSTTTGYTILGTPGQVTSSVFMDAANVAGATTTLVASSPPATLPLAGSSPLAETSSGTLNQVGPFSLTEVAAVNSSGQTFFNLDQSLNLTAVPEPSVPALGALGAAAWMFFRARSRRS